MTDNAELNEFIDLTGHNEFHHLLLAKAALKAREARMNDEKVQIDKRLKEIIGDYANFVCGDMSGTYKYEHRAERVQRETNPRVLRLS